MRVSVRARTNAGRRGWVAGLSVAALALAAPAWASLGQDAASVEADSVEMQGVRTTASAEGYSVHEIQIPTGTVVREFALPDGTVFAVAWQGPFLPNVRRLLGAYYPRFYEAAQARTSRQGRRETVVVETPDLVVETGGHMRALFGRAYIPDLLPSSLPPGALR